MFVNVIYKYLNAATLFSGLFNRLTDSYNTGCSMRHEIHTTVDIMITSLLGHNVTQSGTWVLEAVHAYQTTCHDIPPPQKKPLQS